MSSSAELFNLAVQYHHGGNLAQAEPLYRQILQDDPTHPDAHHMLGILAHQTGHPQAAISLIGRAVALNPNNANAQINLGNVLKEYRQLAEATSCYRQALLINPNNGQALYNLGNVLVEQGQAAEAGACFRQALQINPQHADAHNNLGTLLKEQNQLADATECFREALRINPKYINAHCNLGNALKDQGRFDEAAECYRQALRLDSGHKPTLWNQCLLRLLQGNFPAGWPDFELRFARPGMAGKPYPQPRWDGSPLEGKTILVDTELGLGDTIQFVRYLPMVKERGGTVLLECQTPLVHLLAGIQGADQIIAAGSPLPHFDVHVPLLSLPALFGTTLTTIPAPIPYLRADPKRIKHWQSIIAPPPSFSREPKATAASSGFNIGIAWQTNTLHKGQRHKSFPLFHFESLARVDKVRLISLQVGQGTEQMATAPFTIITLGEQLDAQGAFLDTAAVMMNLDLVVSADTAVAHLAGALGIPVWVPLPLVPDWRWLMERSNSPWYPSMRLFRQTKLGDWGEVFQRIGEEVRKINKYKK